MLEVAISLVYRAGRKIGKLRDIAEPFPRAETVGDMMDPFTERETPFPLPAHCWDGYRSRIAMRFQHVQNPTTYDDEPEEYPGSGLVSAHNHERPAVEAVAEIHSAFTGELLDESIMKVLLLAGGWGRKTLPPTRDADGLGEAPPWVCDFRLTKIEKSASRSWDYPLEDDTDLEDMENLSIGRVMNPPSRRLEIELILLDEIEDVEISPTGVGSDYLMLCHILCSRLGIFKRAKNLPSHEPPSHEEMVRFAQVPGIKTEERPGAVTELAQLAVQGRELAIADWRPFH
ncbi:MAG: hypothetical protein M1839_006945 [Geoglossum umbratile]|nr:MAG: hypothetical protein M1839_006945 [Geoglossum umbratile]